MKIIRFIDTNTIEIISSLLRWFFLIIVIVLFCYPPIANYLSYSFTNALPLIIFSFVYMSITQFFLHTKQENSKLYIYFTRCGVVFDGIAILWLIAISGNPNSPFFLISPLFVIHAALYWNIIGAISSAISMIIGYGVLLYILPISFTGMELYDFIMKSIMLMVIAFYGGIIASRERQYYSEKNYYMLQSLQDGLTGLSNHRSFQVDLQKKLQEGTPFYLLICDIDHFKQVNDQYGHPVGDEVLHSIARILKTNLLTTDSHAYRYGGEEFTVILEENNESQMKEYIQKVTNQLKLVPLNYDQIPVKVTLSFGITRNYHEDSSSEIVKRADELLYLAKHRGRNQYVFEEKGPVINQGS
ncbi:GGDEF domain-containing protein [Salipaludibacillus sp. CF4.18]|uniref:GGDEF domain-containing protein n=1 Tax=Salipaludibacillus sp. CF4.18 TaxID=3373081 RepID=UPI003EE62B13